MVHASMRIALRSFLVTLAFLAIALLPKLARADASTAHTVAVAVLSFDSDDAEEQAEALSGALRSRVRASQGWSLIETSQSLGMLTAALRCPGKPIPAECEQRIAEQIKTERYIFGWLTKGPQAGQVTAEIHLYQKSKPDTVIRESYADNLKDQNDDTLRKIAQRVLDRLGATAVGAILVKVASETGEVIIDGDKRVPLQNGSARLELAPGGHSVEVVTSGPSTQKRNVLVTAGKETVVDLALAGDSARPSRPFPARKVIGAGLAGFGLVAGILSIVNVVAYLDDQDRGEELQADPNPAIRKLPAGKKAGDVCGSELPSTAEICVADDDASRHSTIAIVTGVSAGVLIGIGSYLFFTEGSSSPAEKKTGTLSKPRLAPTFGHNAGGLLLSGSF